MHGTSGIGAIFTLFTGGATVTLTGRSFDPHELWETVQRTECSLISIVGDVFCRPMVEALDEAVEAGTPYDLRTVRSVTSSGVMWSQAIKDRLLAHARAQESPLVTNDSLGASEGVGFAGKESTGDGDTETATFTLGPNAAVFTEDGRRVEAGSGETGLLAVTGPIPLGYYGDPVKTAETFREFEGIRWSVPGDWATIGADGMVTLLGRGSVSINTGGEKVYPEEVEEALKALPEVVDCNVVGVPDPQWAPLSPPWSNWPTVLTPPTPTWSTGFVLRCRVTSFRRTSCGSTRSSGVRTGSRTTSGPSALRWTRWDSARSRRLGVERTCSCDADGVLARWVVSGQTSAVTDIRLAAPADLDTLAATVVTAFDQDPAFRAFFGADPEFGPLAVAFATDLLRRRIATDSVWMTSDGDALAMWDPPAGTVATPAPRRAPRRRSRTTGCLRRCGARSDHRRAALVSGRAGIAPSASGRGACPTRCPGRARRSGCCRCAGGARNDQPRQCGHVRTVGLADRHRTAGHHRLDGLDSSARLTIPALRELCAPLPAQW